MLSKTSSIILLSCLVTSIAVAAPTQSNQNVNINVNPDGAQIVPTHHNDARLKALRAQANQQAASAAKTQDQSFVSAAPDPNDPNYWKNKNSDQTHTNYQAAQSRNNLVSEQQLQRQTTALQQMLSKLRSNQLRYNKVSVVAFKFPKEKVVSGKTAQDKFKSALALPGTIWYATMDSGADSYVPGPVTAEIQEGPFAGGKAVGKFEVIVWTRPPLSRLLLSRNEG